MRETKKTHKPAARSRPYLSRQAKKTQTPPQAHQEQEVMDDVDDNNPGIRSPSYPPVVPTTMTLRNMVAPRDETLQPPQVTPPDPDAHCAWCYELTKPNEFIPPSDVPDSCKHCVAVTCRRCITDWMNIQLSNPSESIRCVCGRDWAHQYMVNVMGQSAMDNRFDRITYRALDKSEYFRWCATDKCTSGQFYGEEVKTDPKICCGECGAVNCFNCRHPFHEGISCEDFKDRDLRKHRGLRDVKTQKAMRDDDARRCPHCGTAVERSSGCDHVTCLTCGDSFDFGRADRF